MSYVGYDHLDFALRPTDARPAPPQAGAFLWLVPRNSYKRGNPGCWINTSRRGAWLSTHREPRKSSTSPYAIAATRGHQRTQVNPTTGATARRRGAVAAAAKLAKARSPRLSHPWHACRREERRRHGDVLAFSALAFYPLLCKAIRATSRDPRPAAIRSDCRSVFAQSLALAPQFR